MNFWSTYKFIHTYSIPFYMILSSLCKITQRIAYFFSLFMQTTRYKIQIHIACSLLIMLNVKVVNDRHSEIKISFEMKLFCCGRGYCSDSHIEFLHVKLNDTNIKCEEI
jgi:hypothetical protein